MNSKHSNVTIEKRSRGAGKNVGSSQYKCQHCDGVFSKRSNLDLHVRSVHTTAPEFNCARCGCTRSLNLEMHMRTCTGAAVASVSSTSSSTPTHRGGAVFTVRRRRRAFGGAAEVHSVDMEEQNQLAALGDAVLSLEPTMVAYQRRHRVYKFQVADGMFHKAVDPAVVTQPPVALRGNMAAVYTGDSPQLEETAARLLELIEVYEHNGSGWVFSNFVTLPLTLYRLNPLRVSAFVSLPKWICDKRAVTNIIGTGDDCFKWAVLAGLHPVDTNCPNRMENYIAHASKYDFSSLIFQFHCLR